MRDAQPPALLQAWQQQGHHIPGNFWGQVSNLRTSAQSPAAGTVLARPPSRFSGISSSRGFQMYNVPVWQQLNSIQPDHVIYAIMGVNIAVFGLWQMFPRSEIMFKNFVCSRYHLGRGYVHTMLTSSISQQTLGHLFSNMFTFYFFGTSLLHAIGTVRVRICLPITAPSCSASHLLISHLLLLLHRCIASLSSAHYSCDDVIDEAQVARNLDMT